MNKKQKIEKSDIIVSVDVKRSLVIVKFDDIELRFTLVQAVRFRMLLSKEISLLQKMEELQK